MKQSLSIRELVLVGLCAALMACFSQLAIPIPFTAVPLTLQAFGVVIIAIILEAKLATLAMTTYVLVGAIGMPVFANFSGGFGAIVGPTGGYIFGFIIMAFIIGWASKRSKTYSVWLGTYIGLGVEYVLGVLQLKVVLNMSMKDAVIAGMAPFILKDLIMVGVGIIVALQIKKRVIGILKQHVSN